MKLNSPNPGIYIHIIIDYAIIANCIHEISKTEPYKRTRDYKAAHEVTFGNSARKFGCLTGVFISVCRLSGVFIFSLGITVKFRAYLLTLHCNTMMKKVGTSQKN